MGHDGCDTSLFGNKKTPPHKGRDLRVSTLIGQQTIRRLTELTLTSAVSRVRAGVGTKVSAGGSEVVVPSW